ncbi:uncharacterized protein [Amphiura filiformis]|uniref:uncharacterized protein n=1 Tax=Amphiura filiformis TaxID=82378 RepID=UPI003B2248D0
MLICFMRLCESYFLSAKDDTNKDDYLDDEVQLMFDVRFFKAIKQSDISQDCRKILAKPPHLRTEKELYHALIAMRNFPAFAEYPLTMQQEIVACGWYARYQAKRVILRQGHMPLNFYFILSGSAVVRVVDKSTGISVTAVYLNKGETFGELGIVNRAARQSTVIAREMIELLCIPDEDYTRIFMAGGLAMLLDPDHSDFVKNLKFLDGWPLPLLAQSSKKCIFSYFKRKDVLVKDSKKSDWIIIVKSGSCSVMKLLYKEVNDEDPMKQGSGKPLPTIRNATKKKKSLTRPRLSVGNLENFEQRQKREDFEDFLKDLEIEDHRESIESTMVKMNSLASIPEEGGKRTGGEKTSKQTKGKKGSGPQLSRTAYLARKKAHERVFQEVAIIADVKPTEDIKETEESTENEMEAEDDITMEEPVGKRKTLIDEIMDTDLVAEMEEGVEPVWVTVQTLTKGSVFGLAEMMFDDQPSFVVVSNGAECILLSKKFYLEHATLAMLSRLRAEENRFPTEDELKSGLEIKLRWNTYKEEHLQNMIEKRQKHRSQDR